MLSSTPETLVKQFGLSPEMGSVLVPRYVHGFQGSKPGDRRTFLSVYMPLAMSGAIAAEGQHPSSVKGWRRGVTQSEMATLSGVHRTTVTRRMSKLSAPSKGCEDARARRHMAQERRRNAVARIELHRAGYEPDSRSSTARPLPPLAVRCEACDGGLSCPTLTRLEKISALPLRELECYRRPEPTPILGRQRRYGMASRYTVKTGQRREVWIIVESSTGAEFEHTYLTGERAVQSCQRLQRLSIARGSDALYRVESRGLQQVHVRAPGLEQLRADPVSGAWWEQKDGQAGQESHIGYKARSKWAWDPRICYPGSTKTLGTGERELMSFYEGKGLLEEWRDAPSPEHPKGKIVKARGVLQIHQTKVAREMGCDPSTVYRWNCVWEKLGVLRIAAGNPRETPAGPRRGPMVVVYVPFRSMTDQEAEMEAERMSRAVRELCASQYARDLWGAAGALRQALEAKSIHRDLLVSWRGSERKMHTLWRSCTEACTAAGISPEFVRHVIPPLCRANAVALGYPTAEPPDTR
jgi:hypothetical protein